MKKLSKAERKKKMVSTMALILAIMLLIGSALPFFSGFVIASPLEKASSNVSLIVENLSDDNQIVVEG